MPPPSRFSGSGGRVERRDDDSGMGNRVLEQLVEAVVDALRVKRLAQVAGSRKEKPGLFRF
jgi:hypothetical protein